MAEIALRFEGRAGGRVARVTVSNSAKLNVLNTALMTALRDTLLGLASDEALRAVVLDGAGERATFGGADIAEMAGLDPDGARRFITLLHESCDAPRRLDVPVIARLRGWTLGGGLELAAACDLRIAAADARFGMPEVRIGIPSVIEAALLPRLIGWGRARRLLLTGETIDATRAETWGLVEEVVPSEALDAAVDRALDAILAGEPGAIRAQKRLLRDWEDRPVADAVARSIDVFADCFAAGTPGRLMGDFLARRRGDAPA